jgi:hypothetical protein
MPWVWTDLVINQEDKTFDSSLGNWTGDATWYPGPIGGRYGLARLSSSGAGDKKSMALHYPNFVLKKVQSLWPSWLKVLPDYTSSFFVTVKFTNGIYTVESTIRREGDQLLEWEVLPAYPPEGFTFNNTLVELTINPEYEAPLVVYCDKFQMFGWVWQPEPIEKKPQYLPIMGVG